MTSRSDQGMKKIVTNKTNYSLNETEMGVQE